VLCTPRHLVNRRLQTGWLYWRNLGLGGAPERLPPEGIASVSLGVYGRHELFMTAEDYGRGYLADFILFLLPNSTPAEEAGAGGSKKTVAAGSQPGRAPAPGNRPAAAPVPNPPLLAFPPAR
jgi:hypothetical protein